MATASEATRSELPIILVRGFGGLDVADDKKLAYYGFNDGTVYPQKQGENYFYEGMVLRFMKSAWRYQDATNVIEQTDDQTWLLPIEGDGFKATFGIQLSFVPPDGEKTLV